MEYSQKRELVCRKSLGNIGPSSETFEEWDKISVHCSDFPYLITFGARESPCNKTVEITLLQHIGTSADGREQYTGYERKCHEGLPPEPRER